MSQFTIFIHNHPNRHDLTTVRNGLTSRPQYWGYYRQKLIHYCGSPEAVFKASKRSLYTISGVGSVTVKNLQSFKAMALAEKELTFNQKHNINAFI